MSAGQPLLTRRQALASAASGAFALALGACAGGVRPAESGSTRQSIWSDQGASGQLRPAIGVGLVDRTELAPRATLDGVLATLAHVTDAHVLDAESPARVTFLDRLGPPFTSTFRPQETLTAQVLDGAVRAIDALDPDAVIQGGDLIDNAQANELSRGLGVLQGGVVYPDSGAPGYFGVQLASDADPFYYRPDIDAPRHRGMLTAATNAFSAYGLRAPWYPVLGDHDVLVQGVLAATPLTDQIARGARAVWELPDELKLPAGTRSLTAAAPDGLPSGALMAPLIHQVLSAPSVRVPADQRRRELAAGEVAGALSRAAGGRGAPLLLDYTLELGEQLMVIVLDLVRREGGSGGLVHPGQLEWLRERLAEAAGRWLLVFSHQPLASSTGGGAALDLLDRQPRVLAVLSGHTHRNQIAPRAGPRGGYWLISTASLIDYPQQARALRVCATAAGAALQTWMLDHVPGGVAGLGDISRELAYLDAQGGRPQSFAGGPLDRNVALYRAG
jgi:3',5'-cyclic AMP phosphodiesterase CpdA